MIPEEAVNAAVMGIRSNANIDLGADRAVEVIARAALEAAAPHLMAPVLALADKWQEDFPDKARQLREAIGDNS